MADLEEMDERTERLLRQLAADTNQCAEKVIEEWGRMIKRINEGLAVFWENFGDFSLPDLPRTPPEIKKDIKHEKNPMRLKQLNKELNESYKVYKRRK